MNGSGEGLNKPGDNRSCRAALGLHKPTKAAATGTQVERTPAECWAAPLTPDRWYKDRDSSHGTITFLGTAELCCLRRASFWGGKCSSCGCRGSAGWRHARGTVSADPLPSTPGSLLVNGPIVTVTDGSAGQNRGLGIASRSPERGSDAHGVFKWKRSVSGTKRHLLQLLQGIVWFPRHSPAGRAVK